MRGVLVGKYVYVEEKVDKLYKQGFGELSGGKLELHVAEATYLAHTGRLKVYEGDRELGVSDLLLMLEGDQFVKYVAYSDLRRKGRVVVYERATEFLRLYPKGRRVGDAPAKELVFPLSEDSLVKHKLILDVVEKVARLRKRLVLAVVDDEMNVTYYTAENFMPEKREPSWRVPEGEFRGYLVGDRVLVVDGGSLYKEGFWGHPLGVEKPRPGELYDAPLQLTLIEAIYLIRKGALTVYSGKKVMTAEELGKLHEKIRERGKVKERVFAYWRDLGYVPKAGSKFGADFLVYEKGPGLEHAPYLCISGGVEEEVRPVDLIRAGRLATSVRKDLVVSLISGNRVISYRIKWFKP